MEIMRLACLFADILLSGENEAICDTIEYFFHSGRDFETLTLC